MEPRTPASTEYSRPKIMICTDRCARAASAVRSQRDGTMSRISSPFVASTLRPGLSGRNVRKGPPFRQPYSAKRIDPLESYPLRIGIDGASLSPETHHPPARSQTPPWRCSQTELAVDPPTLSAWLGVACLPRKPIRFSTFTWTRPASRTPLTLPYTVQPEDNVAQT